MRLQYFKQCPNIIDTVASAPIMKNLTQQIQIPCLIDCDNHLHYKYMEKKVLFLFTGNISASVAFIKLYFCIQQEKFLNR